MIFTVDDAIAQFSVPDAQYTPRWYYDAGRTLVAEIEQLRNRLAHRELNERKAKTSPPLCLQYRCAYCGCLFPNQQDAEMHRCPLP